MMVPSLGAIAGAAAPTRQAAATVLHFATSATGSLVVAVAGLPLVGPDRVGVARARRRGHRHPDRGLIAAQAWPVRRVMLGRSRLITLRRTAPRRHELSPRAGRAALAPGVNRTSGR